MRQSDKLSNLALPTQTDDTFNLSRSFSNTLSQLQALFFGIVTYFSPADTRKKVIIVGKGDLANQLDTFFRSSKSFGHQFMRSFDLRNPKMIAEVKTYCLENEIDEIYFAQTEDQALMQSLAKFADDNFIYFRIATQQPKLQSPKKEVSTYYYDNIQVMGLRKEPLASRSNQTLKRAFDIVFSFCVLCVLVPFVFPIIALAIRLESRGPIFFIQKRPGFKNKLFGCMKFRSMTVNNDTEKQATKNDKRITKVGAFLRKTSLDELPQFINVLKGDMSVVGPRPNMVKQLEYYSQHIEKYSFRHFAMPGITGYAQVSGYRGETETIDLMEKRVEFDIQYMEKWSLWFDMKIIFLTAWNIIVGEENAY